MCAYKASVTLVQGVGQIDYVSPFHALVEPAHAGERHIQDDISQRLGNRKRIVGLVSSRYGSCVQEDQSFRYFLGV